MRAVQRMRTLPIQQPWLIIAVVGGLLVVMMIAGIAGLLVTRSVHEVTEQTLTVDVAMEDSGDDMRTAVLDLRHYHRNLVFSGPSRGGIEAFDAAWQAVHTSINAFDALGISDDAVPRAVDLRAMADEYYRDFRPAVDLYTADAVAFTIASDAGLVRIAALEEAAQRIDLLGEQRSTQALQNAEQATQTATIDLAVILAGLAIVAIGLAFLTVRISTVLRGLYAEQQAASVALAQSLNARNQFIADVSHELRTPITVLRGNAEVGLELDRGGVHGQILEEIVRESTRMSRLVEDLLFLARSDADALPLDVDEIPVERLLVELAAPAATLAQQQAGTLSVEQHGDGDAEVRVDVERLQQAVLILVDNALKYGDRKRPIRLRATTTPDVLLLAVQDAGPGIPRDELPNIFERFYRVDKTRARQLGGAGLGLAIARSIVDAHRGTIDVDSRVAPDPNHGTTFTIRLPRRTEAGARAGVGVAADAHPRAARQLATRQRAS